MSVGDVIVLVGSAAAIVGLLALVVWWAATDSPRWPDR